MILKPYKQAELNPDHPLSLGLTAFLLNEKGGGKVYSTSGQSGALTNVSWVPGGLYFNDDPSEIIIGDYFEFPTESFSIVTRYKPDAGDTNLACVARSNSTLASMTAGYNLGQSNIDSGRWNFQIASGGAAPRAESASGSVDTTKFTTLCGVCDRETDFIYLYVDGILVDSTDISAIGSLANAYNFVIGNTNDGSKGARGTEEFVYVYNRPLAAAEVAGLQVPYQMWRKPSPVFYLVLPSGGTVFNVTVVDGFSGGETLSVGSVFSQSIVDGLSGGDIPSPETEFLNSILDGVTLGESVLPESLFNVPVSDGTLISEDLDGETTFNLDISDGVSLGEVLSGGLLLFATATDGTSIGDSANPALTTLASALDGLSMGDSGIPSVTFNVAVADGAQFTEALSAITTYGISVSDGVNISDAASGAIPGGVSGMVSITFTERGTAVTFNVRRPTISSTVRKPTVDFDI